MDESPELGVLLSLTDCMALYPRLKTEESFLSLDERKVLLAIEKILYKSFSVSEIEELLEKGTFRSDTSRRF